MPELPEVTVIVRGLAKKLKGLVLSSVTNDWPKKFLWGSFSEKDIVGAKVVGVERKGKVIVINLEKPSRRHLSKTQEAIFQVSIIIHLKLTGQLIYQDQKTRIAGGHPIPPLNLPVPNKTTRATFVFASGGHLYFNDLRKFGWVKVVESGELNAESYFKMLGPDMLEMSFEEFAERIKKKPNARIKKLLMDQAFVSGIGNIYSDEGLWRARVHPQRRIDSLGEREIKAIFNGVRASFTLAIEKGGSSANSFVDSGGEKGLFLTTAFAYHMTGMPCARCKTPIVRKKMDGRSAHFCPACQLL